MKRLIKQFLLLIFCICLNINANEKITISNGEWPPFFSQELKDYGITSHIVSQAFKLENIEVQYKWYPWKRAFHLAKNGDIEATVGWEKTKKRERGGKGGERRRSGSEEKLGRACARVIGTFRSGGRGEQCGGRGGCAEIQAWV